MSSLPIAWYRISLSREQFDGGESEIVRAAFRGAYIACNGPRGAALYGGWGDDRATYGLYFTPSALRCARALLKVYSGEPCEPPDTRRLDWLYGDIDLQAGFKLAF